MNSKKLLLCLIGIEAMLILCIALANLNPAPVLYFIISYTGWYSVFWSFVNRNSTLSKSGEVRS